MYKKHAHGFTIPELMIGMTILAILSTIAFVSFQNYASESRDTVRIMDVGNIDLILRLYNGDTGKYPEPSEATEIVHSGAVVWKQGVFGADSIRQTGKIFGELQDPLSKNQYTYSVTNSRTEYQLSYVLEGSDNPLAYNADFGNFELVPQTYAADPFLPGELNPIIWLDARDLDANGINDTGRSSGDDISSWENKGTLGSSGDVTLTHGDVKYMSNAFNWGQPGILVKKNRGMLLNNSDITQGSIFIAIQNRDTHDWSTDSNGTGLQSSSQSNYYIGHYGKRRDSLRIGSSPNHGTSWPATRNGRTQPYMYSFHTDNSNYEFYEGGWLLSQGSTNSITGHEWAINRAGADGKSADFGIAEILVFDTILSENQRQMVESYMAHNWGYDWRLVWNHPYKNTPPESQGPPVTPDTTPGAFTLNDISNATLGTQFTSNSITVTDINQLVPISISGVGTYAINGGSYVSSSGNVNVGDTIRVRQTSSASNSTAVNTTLTIGGVSDTYTVTTIVGDTTPDNFSFNDISDASLSTVYSPNIITVSGVNTDTPISVSGGDAEYRIGTGVSGDMTGAGTASASNTYYQNDPSDAFDNDTWSKGWGNNDTLPASLEYDFGSGDSKVITKYTLYRSSAQQGGWNHNTYSPTHWTFEGSNNGSSWTILDLQTNEIIRKGNTKKEYTFINNSTYRYYRINITESNHWNYDWVNITEMEMISEGGGYTSTPSVVTNGDTVSLRMTSSGTAGSTETATLTVGTESSGFDITTFAPDAIPDTFSFSDVLGATLSTPYTSDIIVSGINTSTTISVSGGGEYRINSGSFTSSPGTVVNGDTVIARQTASSSNSVTVSSTVTIGGVSAIFNVTTPAPPVDTTPDAFTFIDITGAVLGIEYISNPISVTGINTPSAISITGGEFNIDGGAFQTASSTVTSGSEILVRLDSSASPSTTLSAVLTIGGISDTYSVQTFIADTTPDSFTFNAISNAILSTLHTSNGITVSGVNVLTSISVSGGSYSINDGTFTTTAGNVNNGDVIKLQNTSSSSSSTAVNTTVNIGGVSDTFTVTTVAADITPDTFTFNDIVEATLSTQYESDAITISGINSGTNISISGGGEYRIGNGGYTQSAGTVLNGDEIYVRMMSSNSLSSSENTIITIGGISDTYTITTILVEPVIYVPPVIERSNIYVQGNYNGLFTHSSTGGIHYAFVNPSIIASDLSNPNFISIIEDKKLVYTGYGNYPASYRDIDNTLTSTGGFDELRFSGPVIFTGTKEEMASYVGIKEIDNAVRATYNNSIIYNNVSPYIDVYGSTYVENILGNIIGINPIKPFYCSDIFDKKLTQNIAKNATITATENTTWGGAPGIEGISNGVINSTNNLDYEYHSDTINAFIDFNWDTPQKVGYIRIYNRSNLNSSRLSGAHISLYDNTNALLYRHILWDTTDDFVIDLDLEGIDKMYENVSKISIESQGSSSYINLREVEIYVGGNIQDGYYLVDSDGAGGQRPYEVYCDMTTDGGGWTQIGSNIIDRGDFSQGGHVSLYPGGGSNFNRENNILLKDSPIASGYAMQQDGLVDGGNSSEVDYDLIFSNLSAFEVGTELRISAWVADAWDEGTSNDGGKGYIFRNTLRYTDGTNSQNGEVITMEEQVVGGVFWKHQMVRIPIEKDVQGFKWEVGRGAESSPSRSLFFTGLQAEIFRN